LPHAAALFSLQLPLAAATESFDALPGSHSWRSSACGCANHTASKQIPKHLIFHRFGGAWGHWHELFDEILLFQNKILCPTLQRRDKETAVNPRRDERG
jgi:hypothetical protein